MKILFVDPVCPKPYTLTELNQVRMGGTEATCLRVFRELSKRFDVTLTQRGGEAEPVQDYDIVITLRDGKVFRVMQDKYPKARHYLWLHDVVNGEYTKHLMETLSGDKTHNLICVSNWHRMQVLTALQPLSLASVIKAQVIYNPVESYCTRATEYNPKQLIFLSSPHKGLDQVLEMFKVLWTQDPTFELLLANPGYYQDKTELPPGVTPLSEMNCGHHKLMGFVAHSLCTFYPQTIFPETFGLVYAESNALGTPVLCHDIGAAREVLDGHSQIVNCDTVANVINTLLSWSKGARPTVGLNQQFSLSEVTKEWVKLILFDRR